MTTGTRHGGAMTTEECRFERPLTNKRTWDLPLVGAVNHARQKAVTDRPRPVEVDMGLRGRMSLTDKTTFFITTTVVNFAPVFSNENCCDILIRNIVHYQQRYRFRIFGYVIMPTHFHWILHIKPEKGTVSDIMRDIKKYSAWDLLEAVEREGKQSLIFMFERAATPYVDQRRKFWMKRFDDEYIRNEQMLVAKLQYIHNNPVKAGLVVNPEDYKYSSARNYLNNDQSVLFVDTDWLSW